MHKNHKKLFAVVAGVCCWCSSISSRDRGIGTDNGEKQSVPSKAKVKQKLLNHLFRKLQRE